MSDKSEDIKGKQISLSGGRCVFVSHQPDCYFVEFRSKEGSTTRLCLSDEGMYALNVLTAGLPNKGMEIEKVWRQKRQESRWQLSPAIEA